MIGVGDRAPAFDVETSDGGRIQLDEALARGPLVLFFYPKDNTAICTAEVCSFRDAYTAFTEIGAQVLGISSDDTRSHKAFAGKHGLPFPLASDPQGAVRKAYGVPKTFGVFPGRVTFVIDRGGIVRSAFNAQFTAGKHIDTALDVLRSL